MSGRTWLTVGLVVSIALNVAVVGAFIARRARRADAPPFHAMRHVRPQNRDEMRELRRQFRERMDSMHSEMAAAHHSLVELLPLEEPDSAEVERRLHNIARVQQKMNRMAFEVAREMARNLPPEQAQRMYRVFERQYGPPREPRGRRGRRSHHREHGEGESRRGRSPQGGDVRQGGE